MPHLNPHHTPARLDQLEQAAVDVWCARLEPPAEIEGLRDLLSADEQARAAEFHRERDALEFVGSRAMLRSILADYTDIPAKSISFIYGAAGKPALAEQGVRDDIRFNLSHAGGLVLCVVTHGREAGIDVEKIDARLASTAIGELVFSANEMARLLAAPAGYEAETFFTCWTRKEAYVKARGVGAALILPKLDLPPAPGGSMRCGDSEWTLLSFTPAPGYIAAVAVEGSEVDLRVREYRMPTAGFSDAPGGDRGNRAIHAGS